MSTQGSNLRSGLDGEGTETTVKVAPVTYRAPGKEVFYYTAKNALDSLEAMRVMYAYLCETNLSTDATVCLCLSILSEVKPDKNSPVFADHLLKNVKYISLDALNTDIKKRYPTIDMEGSIKVYDEITAGTYAAIVMLLIYYGCKSLNETFYPMNVTNRIRALKSSGLLDADSELIGVRYSNIVRWNAWWHHEGDIRTKFMQELLFDKIGGPLGTAQQQLRILLRWTDMTHIWLIDTYLITNNHFLLVAPACAEELKRLDKAYKLMQGKPKDQRPYIRILCTQTECEVLNRKYYPHLCAAAVSRGRQVEGTLANYKGASENLVTKYEKILGKSKEDKSGVTAQAMMGWSDALTTTLSTVYKEASEK